MLESKMAKASQVYSKMMLAALKEVVDLNSMHILCFSPRVVNFYFIL
jgi:hypothetical protein